jgi:hypothetical protein
MRLSNINWVKVAAALAPLNPSGPFFGPDGAVYGPDGALLVAPATAGTDEHRQSPVSAGGKSDRRQMRVSYARDEHRRTPVSSGTDTYRAAPGSRAAQRRTRRTAVVTAETV